MPPQPLRDRTVLVTASTLGIGFAIAERLLHDGARVIISSRKQKNVDAAIAKLRALGFGPDVVAGTTAHVAKDKDRRALVRFAAEFGGGSINGLVSNAAVQPMAGPTLDLDDKVFDKIFDVNVKSHWQLCKDARPFMKSGGAIVLVSSIAAYRPSPPLGLYGVSKTALLGLARALAEDLGPEGIRCNVLCPGTVRTKFSRMLWENDSMEQMVSAGTFLKRIAEPREMAGAVSFMLSDDASYMTGESMLVAGGMPGRL
jgi:dehydrogenase/reductase SDR family protein 4